MEKDDVELIHNVLSGDENAFSVLVKRYQKGVHALAWRKVKDYHIAEEITQDAFLQAHRKLASLKDPRLFPGWLYVIADRLCRSWFRKKRRKNTQSLETTSEKALEKTDYANYVREQREAEAVAHQREIVQRLMAELPESERTVLVLYYLGEMNCKEISKFLGVSPNTVKSRLRRARERLKSEEHIIYETLGSVPLSPSLTENIMRNIDRVKQTSPSGGKPLLPLAGLGASAILVILLMGASHQYIASFQQPYSLDAELEPTIEIIDAPIVLKSQSKRDLQNRVGNGRTRGRNSNNGLSTGAETVENNLTQESMQWNLPEDAKARLGKGSINEIQYSPDGKLLTVAGGIGVWLYDVTTHQEAALLTEHTSVVNSLAFSPDGRTFASGSSYGTIILSGPIIQLDRSTGEQKMLVGHRHRISSLAFSPDGKTLASDSRDGTIRLWDVVTGEQKWTLEKDSDDATMLSFAPDGRTLVSVSWKEKIHLWDAHTGKHQKTFAMHPDCSVAGAAFNPDGKTVAINSANGTIYLHDLDTGELKLTLPGHKEYMDQLAFSPDGKTLAIASFEDETIRLWDAHTGKHKKTFTAPHDRYIGGLAFSPDGKTLASSSGDGTIRLWGTHTGNEKHTFTGHSQRLFSAALNPNGDIIASGSTTGIINFWDADTGQYIKTLNGLRDGFVEPADSLVFSPNGRTLASSGHDSIRLWDVQTGEHKMQLAKQTDAIVSVAFSPDGKTLASGSRDKTIRLWDAHTGKHKKTLIGHTEDVNSIAFSPDGKTIASGSDDETVRLWDVDTGKNEMTLVGHTEWVNSIAFSPDGKTLASGGGESMILLWDMDTGKTKMGLTGHADWVYTLAFSPDGKMIASGCIDATIHLWDTQTGAYQKTLTGHTAGVDSLAFSSDGKTLVSGSRDGSVLLWKVMK